MSVVSDELKTEAANIMNDENQFPNQSTVTDGIDSSQFSGTISLQIDGPVGELSSTPLINSEEEQSIPRPLIASALSTSSLQAKLVRPLIAGTYETLPAYLLRLQFNFETGNSGWSKRIQGADITVVFEDAPQNTANVEGPVKKWAKLAKPAKHPVITETFPGNEGWEGPVSTVSQEKSVELGLGAGWAGISANVGVTHAVSRERPGTARIVTLRGEGSSQNSVLVKMTENPASRTGIPNFVQLPIILIHQSRRFKMRVTVRATFGFWRGKLASTVPVLGRLDEPLFFDPGVLSEKMEKQERGDDGKKLVEWLGDIQKVNLQEYSSLLKPAA